MGKLANLTVISLNCDADDPHRLLLDPSARVAQTWLRGVPVATAGNS